MQSGNTYMLQVEVPSAFAAIAIITLHPAVRDANGQAHSQEPHWASNLVSSVRGQKLPGPVPVCSGELTSCLSYAPSWQILVPATVMQCR